MERLISLKALILFFTLLPATTFALDVPADGVFIRRLRSVLAGKRDFIQRKVHRLGDRTIEVESFIAMPGNIALFDKIASNYNGWSDWALKDINAPPPGQGDYLLQLHGLSSPRAGRMAAAFSIELPFMTRKRSRLFRLERYRTPASMALHATTVLDESSVVKSAEGYLKAIRADGNNPSYLWVEVRARVEFKGALLYEALPEKVLLREVGDRLKQLVRNYEDAERQMQPLTPVRTQIESRPQRKKGRTG